MDAGGVAIIGACASFVGAVLGAGGALGAARIAARNQSETQHTHWRRQVRRDAYASFLSAAGEVHTVLLKLGPLAGQQQGAELEAIRTELAEAERLYYAWLVTRHGVDLEGPEEVSQAAEEAVRATQFWLIALREAMDKGERVRRPLQVHSAVFGALQYFRTTARTVLDDPGGALDVSAR